jgi:hypothetical protein
LKNVECGKDGICKLLGGDLDGVLEGGGEDGFVLVAGQPVQQRLDDQACLAVFHAAVDGEVLQLRGGARGVVGYQPAPKQQ